MTLFTRVAGWLLLIHPVLFAQPPEVLFVGNSPGKERLSPGVRAEVQVRAPQYPQPAGFIETLTAQVGGLAAPVLLARSSFASVAYLTILIPVELLPGPTTLVVTSGLAGTSSRPYDITLYAYSPGLTGSFVRLTPTGSSPVSCLPGETALPGELVTVKAVGLGPTNPRVPTGTISPGMPPVSTVIMPRIVASGEDAEVLESVLSPGEIGVYAVTFRVPPGVSAGDRSVQLSMGGFDSRDASLSIGQYVTHVPNPGRWPVNMAAPESIVSAYACGAAFANAPATGDSQSPPLALGGVRVTVTDSADVERTAALYYVGRFQINYVIPSGTATGPSTAKITSADGRIHGTTLEIRRVAPSLYTVCCGEEGASIDDDFYFPAGHLVRIRDGVRKVEALFKKDAAGRIVPVPIDTCPDTDELFLEIFGTGLRFRSTLSDVIGAIAGTAVPVEYVGPQSEFPGLDQINLRIPRNVAKSLCNRGGGSASVGLAVDGWFLTAGYLTF